METPIEVFRGSFFLIEYKDKKIFFACDTGPAPFYKDLGKKFGPIDLGFGNIGAYNFFPIINVKDKSTAHANPEELLSIMRDLKVKKSNWNALGNCDLKFRTDLGTSSKV